jgi:hypothetical protein
MENIDEKNIFISSEATSLIIGQTGTVSSFNSKMKSLIFKSFLGIYEYANL